MSPATVHRSAVRLLVLDEAGRILLHHYVTADTGEEFWCTPGGAVAEGESDVDAARRELREEEGLEVEMRLGQPLWERMHIFTIGDGRVFQQQERYYVLRMPAFEPAPAALSDFERDSLIEQRWWTLDELHAASVTLNPPELATLLERASTGATHDP
jgi:8-oxo-dGTP pyrophosphatase MutT (NUDIX family)